jgi:hypothetical protein
MYTQIGQRDQKCKFVFAVNKIILMMRVLDRIVSFSMHVWKWKIVLKKVSFSMAEMGCGQIAQKVQRRRR